MYVHLSVYLSIYLSSLQVRVFHVGRCDFTVDAQQENDIYNEFDTFLHS